LVLFAGHCGRAALMGRCSDRNACEARDRKKPSGDSVRAEPGTPCTKNY